MSIFTAAIDDIFSVPDFRETLEAGGRDVAVVSYASATSEQYTEFGGDGGRTVSVTCRAADWSPSRGERAFFRGLEWKVADFETDSHGLCHTVRLKGVESR